jgi:uncharacterized protein (DUF1810 family)
MWFVFPQLRGLGVSEMSQTYGIADFCEAVDFLGHPILGSRLRSATACVLAHKQWSAEEIFGSHLDACKFQSSMTLFDRAGASDFAFADALVAFFEGARDSVTDGLLGVRADPTLRLALGDELTP